LASEKVLCITSEDIDGNRPGHSTAQPAPGEAKSNSYVLILGIVSSHVGGKTNNHRSRFHCC